jgi:hypothetical protein
MAKAQIDFTKIKIHDKSQNNGFEELCVQLFRGEHGDIESVNRTEEFVQQAVDQLERFTKDEEVTHLLGELNRRSRKEKSQ